MFCIGITAIVHQRSVFSHNCLMLRGKQCSSGRGRGCWRSHLSGGRSPLQRDLYIVRDWLNCKTFNNDLICFPPPFSYIYSVRGSVSSATNRLDPLCDKVKKKLCQKELIVVFKKKSLVDPLNPQPEEHLPDGKKQNLSRKTVFNDKQIER